jgi:hypothetical protein
MRKLARATILGAAGLATVGSAAQPVGRQLSGGYFPWIADVDITVNGLPARALKHAGSTPVLGYTPYVVVATSDERSPPTLLDFEHHVRASYSGNPLVTPVSTHFVIGILGSGASAHLCTDAAAEDLGLVGGILTPNVVTIQGTTGSVDAVITYPIGVFAAGLSAIDALGALDSSQLVGHTNVALLKAPANCSPSPPVVCDVGTPLLSFFTTVISQSEPQSKVIRGNVFQGPDVRFEDMATPISGYAHQIVLEVGGTIPVTTASYYPDTLDLETPDTPTMLTLSPFTVPTGAAFFLNTQLIADNGPTVAVRGMLSTASPFTIAHSSVAADLELPLNPDFTIDICDITGLTTSLPGYIVSTVRIPSLGGAIELKDVPIVVADLASPEGGPLEVAIGTNLFWNRDIVIRPSLFGAGTLYVSDPVANTGACCTSNVCQDDRTEAECVLANGVWFAGEGCAMVACTGNTIPAASSWGLMIAALSICMSGTVILGHRRLTIAST